MIIEIHYILSTHVLQSFRTIFGKIGNLCKQNVTDDISLQE